MAEEFVPALRTMQPTSTTVLEVLDQERSLYLDVSHKIIDQWRQGMASFAIELQIAKSNNNIIKITEMMKEMKNLAQMARTAQEISQNATCDSGKSTAPTEHGGNNTGNAINLYLTPMMASPRIPQPGAPTLELQMLPETPSVPAQGNGVELNGKGENHS